MLVGTVPVGSVAVGSVWSGAVRTDVVRGRLRMSCRRRAVGQREEERVVHPWYTIVFVVVALLGLLVTLAGLLLLGSVIAVNVDPTLFSGIGRQ